jgi:hypothetical protein
MLNYTEILELEIEMLEADIRTRRKLIRKLNRKYEKMDKSKIVFRCANDYLVIDKIEYLLELYNELLIKYI